MSEPKPYAPGAPIADIDLAGIMRCIPHRYPMLLLDKVVEITAFERAVGLKNVTINEPFFPGHFPNDPIMPGVLICEALGQAAAVHVVSSLGPTWRGNQVYFMSLDEVRFRRPVRPGDSLRLEVVLQRSKLGVYRFGGRATVGGQLATEAVFSAKIIGEP